MKFTVNGFPKLAATTGALTLTLFLAACGGQQPPGKVKACENMISQAYNAIERAKADGFGDAMDLTKAGGLLTGAKTQQQFERYDGCIDKATRAKYYANQARAGS